MNPISACAKKLLKQVMSIRDRVYIVHYACSDICPEAATITIQGIAVQHLATRAMQVFEGSEQELLQDFSKFVAQNADKVWAHYDMDGPKFGFGVLVARGKKLGVNVQIPPLGNRFDIKGTLQDLFGEEFAPHPRLNSLLAMNDYNSGSDFDWHTVQWAAQRVRDLAGVLDRIAHGTLKTQGGPTMAANSASSRRKQGGQQRSDLKLDRQIDTAWKSGRYKNYAQLATALNRTKGEVQRAIDRQRHRVPKPKNAA